MSHAGSRRNGANRPDLPAALFAAVLLHACVLALSVPGRPAPARETRLMLRLSPPPPKPAQPEAGPRRAASAMPRRNPAPRARARASRPTPRSGASAPRRLAAAPPVSRMPISPAGAAPAADRHPAPSLPLPGPGASAYLPSSLPRDTPPLAERRPPAPSPAPDESAPAPPDSAAPAGGPAATAATLGLSPAGNGLSTDGDSGERDGGAGRGGRGAGGDGGRPGGGPSSGTRSAPGAARAGSGAGPGPERAPRPPRAAAPAPSPPAPAPAASAASAAPARYRRVRTPGYPREARRRGETGVVFLRVEVDAQGRVSRAELERSSGYPALDEAALRAVRTWEFEPAREGDRPVRSSVTVPVRFRLEGR